MKTMSNRDYRRYYGSDNRRAGLGWSVVIVLVTRALLALFLVLNTSIYTEDKVWFLVFLLTAACPPLLFVHNYMRTCKVTYARYDNDRAHAPICWVRGTLITLAFGAVCYLAVGLVVFFAELVGIESFGDPFLLFSVVLLVVDVGSVYALSLRCVPDKIAIAKTARKNEKEYSR